MKKDFLFKVKRNSQAHSVASGVINYSITDLAFYMVSVRQDSDRSILINDIELGLFGSRAVTISGFCPYQGWKKTERMPPRADRGELEVMTDQEPGTVVRYTKPYEWSMFVNVDAGWVCIGMPDQGSTAVEFVNNCVGVVSDGNLVALWIKPVSLPLSLD